MKNFKLFIGLLTLAIVIACNLSFGYQGYGFVRNGVVSNPLIEAFAREVETTTCRDGSLDANGNPITCNAKSRSVEEKYTCFQITRTYYSANMLPTSADDRVVYTVSSNVSKENLGWENELSCPYPGPSSSNRGFWDYFVDKETSFDKSGTKGFCDKDESDKRCSNFTYQQDCKNLSGT